MARCLQDMRTHCCIRSPRQAAFAIVLAVMFFGTVALGAAGVLQRLADSLRSLGGWAHVVFFLLIVYTGLPFAYGWSIFCIAAGYTLGWWAIITCNLGTITGGLLGAVIARRCFRTWTEAKVASLPERWSRRIQVVQNEISRSTYGFICLTTLLRNCGLITFGIANAIDGAMTHTPLHIIVFAIFVATQYVIVIDIYLGTLIASLPQATNGSDIPQEEKDAKFRMLMGQIGIAIILLVACSLWTRRRLKMMTDGADGVA